jgi:hypothetical protein
MIDLRAEMRVAHAQIRETDRDALIDLGIAAEVVDRFRMCGIEQVSIGNGLYAPAPGGPIAIITPVRVYSRVSPEARAARAYAHWGPIVDLVSWHPAEPERFALRVGAAEWLGCIEPQYLGAGPVPVHRSVLDWLRAGCVGLVLLSADPADQYRALCCCDGIVAASAEHGKALRRVLARPWPHPSVEEATDAA